MSFAAGDKPGPYEVTAHVGVGGTGEVYRVRDSRLNREVVIKVPQNNSRSDPLTALLAAL
jgi:serine/threonine protein kinase